MAYLAQLSLHWPYNRADFLFLKVSSNVILLFFLLAVYLPCSGLLYPPYLCLLLLVLQEDWQLRRRRAQCNNIFVDSRIRTSIILIHLFDEAKWRARGSRNNYCHRAAVLETLRSLTIDNQCFSENMSQWNETMATYTVINVIISLSVVNCALTFIFIFRL